MSQIKLPKSERTEEDVKMIALCHPTFPNESIAFAADGMKTPLQSSRDFTLQECFYNGWKHGHFTSHVFVFAPDGTILIIPINVPSSIAVSRGNFPSELD